MFEIVFLKAAIELDNAISLGSLFHSVISCPYGYKEYLYVGCVEEYSTMERVEYEWPEDCSLAPS